jgi:hypothetical protein
MLLVPYQEVAQSTKRHVESAALVTGSAALQQLNSFDLSRAYFADQHMNHTKTWIPESVLVVNGEVDGGEFGPWRSFISMI